MRALVAMSGGVDSSVAAALMLEAGHDVVGVTLKQWEGPDGSLPEAGCCTVGDAEDARRVAAQLDVPYYVLDYVDEFKAAVVDHFGEMYRNGLTPNPCIECNRRVRFKAMLDRVVQLDCDVLVTGHHARVTHDDEGFHLRKGFDESKDQSYVLHMLGQEALSKVVLPVGEMTKDDVRRHAARLDLRTASKPDSQDLCFVGTGDYRDFLKENFPDSGRPGSIVDLDAGPVGTHGGTADFTVGQRKGLGVALGEPRYVVKIEPTTATVVIGRKERLLASGCEVNEVTFVAGHPPSDASVSVKIRYRSAAVPARLTREEHSWRVTFDRPHSAVAPGQAAVFYRDDEVLGGGTIVASTRE